MLPENAAITFVALGTSLPDTFASMTAAKVDPSADASIGNVTGSNSVNVFLGVGIAWAMAAFKWNLAEPTVEWSKRILKQEPDVIKNVGEFLAGSKNAVFVTPAGTLWFNLMVFCLNATCALLILYARRDEEVEDRQTVLPHAGGSHHGLPLGRLCLLCPVVSPHLGGYVRLAFFHGKVPPATGGGGGGGGYI